jgi:hypothetical protein
MGCLTGYDKFGTLHPNPVGLVFRALLGYRATPTFSMCVVYCLYWMIVSNIMMWRYKQVVCIKTDRDRQTDRQGERDRERERERERDSLELRALSSK